MGQNWAGHEGSWLFESETLERLRAEGAVRVGSAYNRGSRVLTKRRAVVLGLIRCYRKGKMRVRVGRILSLDSSLPLARISGPGHM